MLFEYFITSGTRLKFKTLFEIFQLVTFSYPYFRLSKLRVIHMTSYREIFFFYEDFYHPTITLSRVQFFINRC